MSHTHRTGGLMRLVRACGYSAQGFRACFQYEAAFRQELGLAVVLIPLALWLGNNGVEQVLLLGSWVLVMIVELVNSAIEATVDRSGPDQHTLAGRAKDIASAAVFLSIALAFATWALVLVPRLS